MIEKKQNQGNDRLLIGFILSILTFWLFANSMLNISPIIGKDLQIGANTMNIAVSVAALFSGIFVVVLGGFADSFGRVRILRIGLYLNVVGSLIIAIVPSGGSSAASPLLLTGRVFQGLSAACVMPTTLALVKIMWTGITQQRAISYWSMGSFGGSGFSALFAGIITSNLGWRWVFIFSIIVSLVALFLIKGLPESKKAKVGNYKVDYIGIFIFLISIISLQIFLTKGGTYGWFSLISIVLVLVSIIAFVIFYYYEVRSSNCFFDFSLFKNSVFSGDIACNFLMNASAGVIIIALSLMQTAANYSSQQAGLLTLGYAIAVILFIRAGEILMRKIGARKPMVWGALIVAFATILLMQTYVVTGLYKYLALVAFTFFGTGLAFFATPATTVSLSNLPDE